MPRRRDDILHGELHVEERKGEKGLYFEDLMRKVARLQLNGGSLYCRFYCVALLRYCCF